VSKAFDDLSEQCRDLCDEYNRMETEEHECKIAHTKAQLRLMELKPLMKRAKERIERITRDLERLRSGG